MSLKRWFMLAILVPVGCALAVAALPLFFVAGRHVAQAAPDCVSGPAGLAAYYFDGSQGTLNLSDGGTWVITLTGIDGSAVTGNKTYHLLVQDHGTGSGWETLPTQTHHDFYGAGGHLLQSDDNGWTVRSSHGFNPGDVSGTYDLRVVMSQRTDDKWDISPYFRLPGGNWTLFYDGAWTTATAFDLTKTRVAVGIDAGGDGTLCFAAPTANAVDLTNVFVDDDWVGLPNGEEVLFPGDPNPHYIGLDAFATIQDGIDNAASGGTVSVADGTYTATSLASIVITTNGLSLVGQSRDGTIIDAGSWGTSGAGWPRGIQVYANDVTIRDLTVQGFTGDQVNTGGYGIVFRDWAHDTSGEGYIFYSGGIVENVKLDNNYSSMYALVHRNLTVRDSLIQDSLADGMFIARESDNATITGNTVLNSGNHGIWVGYDWATVGPSDNAAITGNVVDGAIEGGISFVASNGAVISGNDVSHVKGEEPEGAFGGWSRGAISLKDGVSNVTVSDNVVHDNDGLGTGSGRAIGVDGTSSNITVTGNTIRDNAGGGIKVMGTTSGWTANSNSIYSNTGYGAQNVTGAVLDFTDNWWGSADGPTHASNTFNVVSQGVSVSDNVDFVPWLDGPPSTGTSFAPVTTTSPADSYASIQAGVDASYAGGTVNAAAGTFLEQPEIAQDLTLQGAGASTIIQSPDTLTKKFITGTSTNNFPVVYIHDASDVTVQDLVVDGAGKGNANFRFSGIAFRNAGGAVSNTEIKDVRNTPFSGAQHGVALYAYNDDGTARTIAVSDNVITGFQKNGMALNAGDTTPLAVSVLRNEVTGYGATTVTAQNGIQVSATQGTGTVSENTVTGIAYDNTANPIKYVATSILNFYADLDISGNTVDDGHLGVYSIDGSGQINGNDITIDKVGVYAFGIIATDPPGAVPSPFDDGEAEAGGPRGTADLAGPLAMTVLGMEASGNEVTFGGGDNTWTFGIEADAGWGDDDLAFTANDNIVTGFEVGIEIYACESGCGSGVFTSIEAHQNDLAGNTIGMRSNVTYLTADAEDNWWGSADGPTHVSNTFNVATQGVPVSDNVDFVPWLDAAPPGGASFAPVTTTSPSDSYASIEAGIDGCDPGGTVNAKAGTFTEIGQIVISKNVTVAGAGVGSTTVVPSADTGSAGDARGWFLVNPGMTFNLSDVTLDGTGRKVWQAIRHKGQGSVSDCAFTNIKYNESGPSYAGTAIAAFGSPAMNVDVTNCTFSGIGRIGVQYFGSGVTGSTYSNNTYVGKGAGDWLDYGVEVGGGAHATISGSTISDDLGVASVDGSTSAGILVTTYFGAGSQATISGNTISNSSAGIAVGYNASDTSVVEVSGNTISAPTTGSGDSGFDSIGTVSVNVHDNTFTGGYDAVLVRRGATGTIASNVMSGYAKNGITVGKAADDNTGTNVAVSGNIVTGGGAGQVNAQNGIQVGPNAMATIQSNSVSDHVYTLGTGACAGPGTKGDAAYYAACWTAAGVLVYQGTATITDNIVSDNQVGIDVASSAAVHHNIIAGNVIYGMNNNTTVLMNAEQNWWGACSGPYHPSLNPLGTGDAVSDYVDFTPWIRGACDYDGDLLTDDSEQLVWLTDWQDPDTDGDGCADGEEALYSEPTLGGQRDPLNHWDFFDVVAPLKVIDLDDAFGVLGKFGAVCGNPVPSAPPYGEAYDRSAPTPNPWNTQAPDCVIDLNEFFWNLASFGHSCFPAP
jgi:hypothetical protein